MSLKEMGEFAKAVDDLDRAIELSPARADLLGDRGYAVLDLGQPLRAVEDLKWALELDPESASAHVCRGLAFAELE